ncbi:hypothetical protein [Microvirga pudoricolor]|uniref:hypothetical protein n=1 Tax=Microvirga pudoricolor TaxID=2778729 RepID=UPI00194FA144|nr:hypothetical protein [Microvirga pudoricolor]MBM6596311.1 hypothetical protein [Microvirga pudoricolor]
MRRFLLAMSALSVLTTGASAQDFDVKVFFAKAADTGRAGLAQKTRMVDARPAEPGEVVVTVIKSEGVETRSKPAEAGDMVVRNRCPETGSEQYLVKAANFTKRYSPPQGEAAQGWRPYKPLGTPMRYVTLAASEGPFSFRAPWGEAMVAKPGDAIVQDPANAADTYRIAAASFACTYDVTEAPKAKS